MLDILVPAILGIVALCIGGIIGYVIRKKTAELPFPRFRARLLPRRASKT